MKKIGLLIFMMICLNQVIHSQITQEQLDRAKQEAQNATDSKKEKEKIYEALLDSAMTQNAIAAIEERNFVLEADKVTFKRGNWKYVSANTNFISLSGDNATVQIAFDGAPPGPNGIGGITLDGLASNVEVKKDKKGNIQFSMNVTGAGISAIIEIEVTHGSNNAMATVTPNFSSNRFTLTGALYPTSESSVFKGRSL